MKRNLLLILIPLLSFDVIADDAADVSVSDRVKSIQTSKANRADRQFWRSELKWSDECESSFNYPESVSGITLYPVNSNEYLFRITCTFGSYQGQHHLYLVSTGQQIQSRAIKLHQYKIESNKVIIKKASTTFWGEVLEGTRPASLKILNLYSGAGHCGILTTYKFVDGKMNTTKIKAQPNCEAQKKVREPEKWREYKVQ